MRVAVVGASGRIGRLVVDVLTRDGHEAVPISRAHGVDVHAGTGLDAALAGVECVLDVLNNMATEVSESVDFFTTTTQRLLASEQRMGVRHHVALSIAGVEKVPGNAHYAGKRAQEEAVARGSVPHTIVPATQFHDFPEMVASWTEVDGVAQVAPLLLQPIAPGDVAEILGRIVTGAPCGRHVDIAGPDRQDLVDMARRTLVARGRSVRLVPSWDTGIFDTSMAGDVLLPGTDAEIAPTSFEDWLRTV